VFAGDEVGALEELVAGYHQVLCRRAKYRRIVANSKPQRTALGGGNAAAYAVNQFVFGNSQWRGQFAGKLYSERNISNWRFANSPFSHPKLSYRLSKVP
jgi:hypothetical protein